MNFIGILLVLIYANILETDGQSGNGVHFLWQEIEEWSSCSQKCGLGNQQKKKVCIEKTIYSETLTSDENCQNTSFQSPVVRSCNMGECKDKYMWRPGKWSDCSHNCGESGRKTRDVECVYDEGNGNLVTSDFQHCDQMLRPEVSSICNNFDCPLKYFPGKWGECKRSNRCLPGKQIRSLMCISILKTGEKKYMPRDACSRNKIPPPRSWQICYDHINTKECLKGNPRLPLIETKLNTLIQMRKTKILNIVVGQIAYVLLYTRITIECPVKYFVPQEVEWMHGTELYKYQGKSKANIKVDKKGRLRIRKFETQNQGTWTCIAGPVNATTTIKIRNPSAGFQDWVLRSSLWMLNEDPESGLVRNEVVQWIKKAWSPCSVTCGGDGIQTRDVKCEELDTRFYNILKDEVCERQGQKKPINIRSCHMGSQCPKWVLNDAEHNKCTNSCVRIGFANVSGTLKCMHQEKEMDSNLCNKKEMPDVECPNDQCQVIWKKSAWSKCSRSCGGYGIMARYLICIWKNSEVPAGSLCYNQKLPNPKVIKSCRAPRCNLRCVDLSPSCTSKRKFCKFDLYRYTCCHTCSRSNIYSEMQNDKANSKISRRKDSSKKGKEWKDHKSIRIDKMSSRFKSENTRVVHKPNHFTNSLNKGGTSFSYSNSLEGITRRSAILNNTVPRSKMSQ